MPSRGRCPGSRDVGNELTSGVGAVLAPGRVRVGVPRPLAHIAGHALETEPMETRTARRARPHGVRLPIRVRIQPLRGQQRIQARRATPGPPRTVTVGLARMLPLSFGGKPIARRAAVPDHPFRMQLAVGERDVATRRGAVPGRAPSGIRAGHLVGNRRPAVEHRPEVGKTQGITPRHAIDGQVGPLVDRATASQTQLLQRTLFDGRSVEDVLPKGLIDLGGHHLEVP